MPELACTFGKGCSLRVCARNTHFGVFFLCLFSPGLTHQKLNGWSFLVQCPITVLISTITLAGKERGKIFTISLLYLKRLTLETRARFYYASSPVNINNKDKNLALLAKLTAITVCSALYSCEDQCFSVFREEGGRFYRGWKTD